MVNVEVVIWYLFVIDAVGANLVSFFWQKKWNKSKLRKIVPMNKLWTLLYLGLVIWVGFALDRLIGIW